MEDMHVSAITIFIILPLVFSTGLSLSPSLVVVNNCSFTVWPSIVSTREEEPSSTTGFVLQSGEYQTLSVSPSWSGILWGRTLCTHDFTGKFLCITGDCGSGTLECSGTRVIPSATMAVFALNGVNGIDQYHISLIDGYNLPLRVAARSAMGEYCPTVDCSADLDRDCPTDLKVIFGDGTETVACEGECRVFGDPQNCCSGACKTSYVDQFNRACPHAKVSVYQDEDGKTTFTCTSGYYVATFCPDNRIRGNRPFPSNSDGSDHSSGSSGRTKSLKLILGLLGSCVGVVTIPGSVYLLIKKRKSTPSKAVATVGRDKNIICCVC